MRAIVLLALCVAAVSAVPAHLQRIIGGSLTTVEAYPQIAALLYNTRGTVFQQSCAGTILNNRSVLTAAHCSFGDSITRWRIRVGSTWANSGGAIHSLFNMIYHSNFNQLSGDSDIAIMRVTGTIVHNNAARPASIAGANYNLADNQVVWAPGWGITSVGGPGSEQLRHVQVWTINQATCRNRYATVLWTITDNMLCSGWLDVGGRDQCNGDSGGPLYHNGVVVGVCSFGFRCGDAYYPGINSRVSRFTSWIQSNA